MRGLLFLVLLFVGIGILTAVARVLRNKPAELRMPEFGESTCRLFQAGITINRCAAD